MTSLSQIDDAFRISENKELFDRAASFLLNDGGDFSKMDDIMGMDADIQRDERSSDEEEEEYTCSDESGSDNEEEQPEMVLFPLNPQDALYDKGSLRKQG